MDDTGLIQSLLSIIRDADTLTRSNIIAYILSVIPPDTFAAVVDYVTTIA